jgi:predicted nucleic acid-binding protein
MRDHGSGSRRENLAHAEGLGYMKALIETTTMEIPDMLGTFVYQELRASSSQPPGHIDFDAAPWLIVAALTDRLRVEALREDLDLGEAEATVLAMERRAACCSSTNGAGDGLPRPQG